MINDEDYDDSFDEDEDHSGERDFDEEDYSEFADPGGNSALRAETASNPRNLPCPTCEAPNRLTPADVSHGYQCDSCADQDERGGGY